MNYLILFLAVFIGYFLALILKVKKVKKLSIYLAFSGAFLLALTIFELLPDVYETPNKLIGVYIISGILLQIILELFSKGAEHGHVHIHKHETTFPWLLFISLCIHSFLEGFPIHQHNDMVYGVLVHKVPIAALISMFLFQSKFSKMQIIAFLLVFTAMTPLGTYISNTSNLSIQLAHSINAIVIGIFFHISTTILFESGEGHKFNLSKFVSIILGVGVAYLI